VKRDHARDDHDRAHVNKKKAFATQIDKTEPPLSQAIAVDRNGYTLISRALDGTYSLKERTTLSFGPVGHRSLRHFFR
jgi:hypothetical protein